MTLRCKTQLFLGTILLSVLLILDVMFTNFLITSAEQTDRERMTRDLSRTFVTLSGEVRTLSAIAGNWAYSDKAWDYMTGHDPDYPNIYLNRTVLTEIGVSSLIFVDNDLNIKFSRDYSAPDDSSTPESEIEAIFSNQGEAIFQNLPDDGTSGIVMKGENPIIFAVKHIRRSDKGGSQAGYLIATMALSPKMIHKIASNLHFTFAIEPVLNKDRGKELPHIVLNNDPRNSFITGRILVRDHAGAPAFWISGITSNVDIKSAERELQMLFFILAVAALFVVLLFGIFMKHQVTNRMKRLQREIEAIRDEAADARGITIDRKRDEIASVQRTLNDFMAFFDFKQGEKNKADDITISVYKRFAEAGRRLCMKTLEDIATAFSPGDEKFRAALTRCAAMTRDFAKEAGLEEEELIYIYMGALFSRMGMLSLPFSIRTKTSPLTPAELREYRKYPIKSRDFMEEIELLRPASALPYAWNENWDGTGFPQGLSGSAIPLTARIFAVVDAWNEMTRPWPGRRIPTDDEVVEKLRAQAGTRLDPQIVEKFSGYLKRQKQS